MIAKVKKISLSNYKVVFMSTQSCKSIADFFKSGRDLIVSHARGLLQGGRPGIFFVILVLGFQTLSGSVLRTQSFELKQGWNAIYLDVDPAVRDPEVVFAGTSVDIVASYEGSAFTKQFSATPGADLLSELGWATWYAPSRDDTFLSRLGAVYGRKVYLVHAQSDTPLSVKGTVTCTPVIWSADSYNLVGFPLDAQAAPTFAQFFGGSAAHRNSSVYRLTGGAWKKIIDPANTAMKSGEAFWIYTEGPSSYQGPLRVTAGTAGGVLVLREGRTEQMIVKNCSLYPLSFRIEHFVPEGGQLPLAIVVDVVGGVWEGLQRVAADLGEGAWAVDLPALEAEAGFKIPLALHSGKLAATEAHSLLCIKSDLGTEVWVPVSATREELK